MGLIFQSNYAIAICIANAYEAAFVVLTIDRKLQ